MKFNIDFWSSSTEDFFNKTLLELQEHGYTEEEAINLLENLYGVVASEYGE